MLEVAHHWGSAQPKRRRGHLAPSGVAVPTETKQWAFTGMRRNWTPLGTVVGAENGARVENSGSSKN